MSSCTVSRRKVFEDISDEEISEPEEGEGDESQDDTNDLDSLTRSGAPMDDIYNEFLQSLQEDHGKHMPTQS